MLKTAYSGVITGQAEGSGVITVTYKEHILRKINVIVEDRKGLYLTPDITELKLNYKETFKFETVSFVNNGVKTEIVVNTADKPPFTFKVTEETPNSHIYTIEVTNNASAGGVGNLIIRGEGTTDGQKVIDIKS